MGAATDPSASHPESVAIEPSADVAATARLGDGVRIWHLAQVREDASLGSGCVVGRGVYVGPGVTVGENVKIQNYALVYEPATVGSGAFVGPAAVLTNDLRPRSVDENGQVKGSADWTPFGVVVGEGASLGARSVCVAPVRVGRWAMVGAGAVVTKDVPDYALVVGVPARWIGWVGRAGERLLPDGENIWRCPRTGDHYVEQEGRLHEVDA
jgi:acetyltransferase-like isoleucine patch superfamily enzyme